MKILFVHNNFPGQFAKIARDLASRSDVQVRAIGSLTAKAMNGVGVIRYKAPRGSHPTVHPFARRFDLDCSYAEEVLYCAQQLKDEGFHPDVIFVHPGWGEALPLPLLFPHAKMIVYSEFFYKAAGADVGFDNAYGSLGIDGLIRTELRNASQLLAFQNATAAVAPTHWQRSLYPDTIQPQIKVIHDGIDTNLLRPDPGAQLFLSPTQTLTRADRVLSFVARSLEPMRGFHVFMATLPPLLRNHPDLQVVIVGDDRPSYGNAPEHSASWREACLNDFGQTIDLERVHFRPRLPYNQLIALFQLTSVHFYASYPFVLSWSLLEAMSCGAFVVGSHTAPVEEVISDDKTGALVPFHNVDAYVESISKALSDPHHARSRGAMARQHVIERYDFETVTKPAYYELIAYTVGDSEFRSTGTLVQ